MAVAIQEEFAVAPRFIRSGGGVFELSVNDKLVFSKKSTGRFPETDEAIRLISEVLA